jgi:hypothetical protein
MTKFSTRFAAVFNFLSMCLFCNANAQPSGIAWLAEALIKQPQRAKFLTMARGTALGEALSPALEKGFETDVAFMSRLILEVLRTSPNQLETLLSRTRAIPELTTARPEGRNYSVPITQGRP